MQTINGHEIPTDAEGRVNMTEIWKRSGNPNKEPAQFKRLKRVQKILAVMDWFARRGHGASTWADYLLAMDYADYVGLKRPTPSAADLDAEWADAKRRARERYENDPDVQERARARAEDQAARAAKFDEEMEEQRREWDEATAELDEYIANLDAGEEWKGSDYHYATAGEEWKDGQGDGEGGEDKPSHTAWERGPDHFFMDNVNYRDTEIRASVN